MDFVLLESIVTVLAFASFIGVVLWAFSGRARRRFDEAERLPFADDDVARERGEAPR